MSTQRQESSGRWLKRPNLGCQVYCGCHNTKSCSLKANDQRDRGGLVVGGLRISDDYFFLFPYLILMKEEL